MLALEDYHPQLQTDGLWAKTLEINKFISRLAAGKFIAGICDLGTGADLLWRLRADLILPREEELPDGSFLSTFYESAKHRKNKQGGIKVRVVEYTLEGIQEAEPMYRLATTVLDVVKASGQELAALYHERWEIESAFDELKTHLRGRQMTLRSKTPDLVRQEFYGLVMAHFAIRGLMHEAALK